MNIVMWDTLGFGIKALIGLLTFVLATIFVLSRARNERAWSRSGKLEIQFLNDALRQASEMLHSAITPAKQYRKHAKQRLQALKNRKEPEANVYVLDFKGDLMASAVESLRAEVSAVLTIIRPEQDEVVLRLESSGGAAHSYGFAASQLARLRSAGVPLTVCVDRVAASGGYMMACVANQIVAAPFAILGSIGVAAPVPNMHRLIDRLGIDYENATAGAYKRTVSLLAENNPQGRQKFQEQLEETHALFKDFVKENRPSLDVEAVATGEHWHGRRAHELGLINTIMTSDDYLMRKLDDANIYRISFERPNPIRERLAGAVSSTVTRLLNLAWNHRTSPYT